MEILDQVILLLLIVCVFIYFRPTFLFDKYGRNQKLGFQYDDCHVINLGTVIILVSIFIGVFNN